MIKQKFSKKTVSFTDGKSVFEYLLNLPPSCCNIRGRLLILDIKMAGWDGYETARKIKEAVFAKKIPNDVIMVGLTAFTEPKTKLDCL